MDGLLSTGGMICSHSLSNLTEVLSFTEALDLLEAQQARTCVPVSSTLPVCSDDQTVGTPVAMPARGASIVVPITDYGVLETELEQACRMLGSQCTAQAQAIIAQMRRQVSARVP